MPRKVDPNTRYRVYIHTDRKYRYAAVQVKLTDESGKVRYKVHHLGTVDEGMVFKPNATAGRKAGLPNALYSVKGIFSIKLQIMRIRTMMSESVGLKLCYCGDLSCPWCIITPGKRFPV